MLIFIGRDYYYRQGLSLSARIIIMGRHLCDQQEFIGTYVISRNFCRCTIVEVGKLRQVTLRLPFRRARRLIEYKRLKQTALLIHYMLSN
jgi:hypothetical protein